MSEDTNTDIAVKTTEKTDPWHDIPGTTESLLDAQLGEALKIMRDFALWIHSPNTEMVDCLEVSGRVSQLMLSSAQTARAATKARLALQSLATQMPAAEG